MKKSSRKKQSKAKHLNKLTMVFNKYIRKRDCLSGCGSCISCGEIFPYEELNAGHYHHSKASILRFNEINVNGQCTGCNSFKSGNLIGYREGLVLKHGEDKVKEIEAIRYQQLNMTHEEIDEQIEIYKNKFNLLQKNTY